MTHRDVTIVTIEEHFTTREARDTRSSLDPARQDASVTFCTDGETGGTR